MMFGGIELEITSAEKDYINSRVNESYKVSGNTAKLVSSYGKTTLTGEQALTHSRNRTIGNDFTRAGRQRDVIEALMSKLSTLSSSKLNSTIDLMLKEVRTNVNVTGYLGFLTDVLLNKNAYMNNITSVQIPSTDYADGKMIDGVYYFVADMDKARADMIDTIYKK